MSRRNSELESLRARLREAEETLAAIHNGQVDALVVNGPQGEQVFSLKGAEQPYRIFVEQMQEGAVTLASDGTILYCNRRFAQMMRARMETIIGSSIRSFLRSQDHAEVDGTLANPDGCKVRFVLPAADGTFIPAQLAFSHLPLEADGPQAICVVVTDLTEQEEKRELATAIQDLQKAQEQLRQQNEELMRARTLAESANASKDEFLAALSHELRTPLTPVLMTIADLEHHDGLPAALQQQMSILRRNVELEARLIDDLLDVTRIARGKVELKLGIVDVHSVLAGAIEICRRDIDAKHLHLDQELAAPRSQVRGDAVRLQQVLWNLIRNAVKFTPKRGRITVRTECQDQTLRIKVSDTGIGIDSSALARIFTPFEQADRLITRQFGGLGLGLSISKRLIELQEGTLVAHSGGRDQGAEFTVTLPLAPVQRKTIHSQRHPKTREASRESPSATRGPRSLRILLVEDHEDTRRSMARLLGLRHTVRDVDSIAGALRAAGAEAFDLIISDVGLPDGSGLDLMRQLRLKHGIQGICLTGFGMEEDVARSADAGFCHHLTKPIDIDELEMIIQSIPIKDISEHAAGSRAPH